MKPFEFRLWRGSRSYRLYSETDRAVFNETLCSLPNGSPFQTWEWGELKSTQGWQPYRLILEYQDRPVAAVTILKRTAAGLPIFYSPRGPIMDVGYSPELLPHLARGIASLAAREGAVVWRIDPEWPMELSHRNFRPAGFKAVPMSNPFGGIQPRWVWRIPLANNPDEQWKLLKKGARRQIDKARKSTIEIRDGTRNDLPVFYGLLQETARRNRFLLRGLQYYEKLWDSLARCTELKMALAWHEGVPVATALVAGFGSGVWDLYAGYTKADKDLGASYLLTWELIAWAAARGYRFYDLGGVAPQCGEDHPLSGLLFFKSRFGGSVTEFAGEYDLVLRPVAYRLWNLGHHGLHLINSIRKKLRAERPHAGTRASNHITHQPTGPGAGKSRNSTET